MDAQAIRASPTVHRAAVPPFGRGRRGFSEFSSGPRHMEPRQTRASLLSRLREPSDDAAWREFDGTYRELIVRYCRSRHLQAADAEDVRQIVMLNLTRTLPSFAYDPARGRFRHYLCRTIRNAIFQFYARPSQRGEALSHVEPSLLATDDAAEQDEIWQREWMDHHYRLAMKTIRATFEPRSVEVFDRLLKESS